MEIVEITLILVINKTRSTRHQFDRHHCTRLHDFLALINLPTNGITNTWCRSIDFLEVLFTWSRRCCSYISVDKQLAAPSWASICADDRSMIFISLYMYMSWQTKLQRFVSWGEKTTTQQRDFSGWWGGAAAAAMAASCCSCIGWWSRVLGLQLLRLSKLQELIQLKVCVSVETCFWIGYIHVHWSPICKYASFLSIFFHWVFRDRKTD